MNRTYKCDYCNMTLHAVKELNVEELDNEGFRYTGPNGIDLVCSKKCELKALEYWTDEIYEGRKNV